MTTDDLLSRLQGVKRNGAGWMARCPAHDDRQASLKVDEADDKILIHCHAGCTARAVTDALGLAMKDLRFEEPRPWVSTGNPSRPAEPKPKLTPQETYTYTDSAGKPVFEVVRMLDEHGKKEFPQRLVGASDWGGVAEIAEKPLYHLPELLERIRTQPHRRVWIVEGEKDVHAIEQAGGVATCNSGGAGKWGPHYVNWLHGAREIRVVADKDDIGIKHAQEVRDSLGSMKSEIVQARFGKDAFDHLEGGGTLDNFVLMPPSRGGIALVRGDMQLPETVEWIPGYEDFIPVGGITHLAGMPGVNKSTFTCRLGADITKLGLSVFLITSEDSVSSVILPRLVAAGADMSKVFTSAVHLTIPTHLNAIEAHVEHEKIGLLVIDPIDAHLDASVDSYKNQSIRGALAPLAFMASKLHCAVVLVGHPNKDTRRDPMMRVGGSIGIPGIARSALMMGNHPHSPEESGLRVIASYKGNWAQKPEARIYKIELGAGGEAIWLSLYGTAKIQPWQLLPKNPPKSPPPKDEEAG